MGHVRVVGFVTLQSAWGIS